MLELEDRSWKIEVGSEAYSLFHIPYTLALACVKAVCSMGIVGVFNSNLNTAKTLTSSLLRITRGFITNVYRAYTTGFARLLGGVFNQLNSLLINTFHTTNKDNEILYKLIIINSGR